MWKRVLNALALTIGPTIWISSLVMFVYGLWQGAWYGYLMGAFLIAVAGSILIAMYRVHRTEEAELARMVREWEARGEFDE